MGLDVSYLGDVGSNVLDEIAKENVEVSDIQLDTSGILTQSHSVSTDDCSGELCQQFSHLKIPSDSSQTSSVENHFVQSQLNFGIVEGPQISEFSRQGLKVVGTINIPYSSSLSSTTSSFATSPAVISNENLVKMSDEVRDTNMVKGLVTEPLAHISLHSDVIGIPLQVATNTTEAANVFVMSMTVDNTNTNENTIPACEGVTKKINPLDTNENTIPACEAVTKKINPLDTTLIAPPEPQRASTPNDYHLESVVMDDTIVAGFSGGYNNTATPNKNGGNSRTYPEVCSIEKLKEQSGGDKKTATEVSSMKTAKEVSSLKAVKKQSGGDKKTATEVSSMKTAKEVSSLKAVKEQSRGDKKNTTELSRLKETSQKFYKKKCEEEKTLEESHDLTLKIEDKKVCAMNSKEKYVSLQELKDREKQEKKNRLQKGAIEFIPTYTSSTSMGLMRNEDVHNKTYCRNWIQDTTGNVTQHVHDAQSDYPTNISCL